MLAVTAYARPVVLNPLRSTNRKNELFSRPLVPDTTFNDVFGARLMTT